MRFFFLCLILSYSRCEEESDDLNDRLGLLGPTLGLSPLATSNSSENFETYEDYYNYEYETEGENNEGGVSSSLTALEDPSSDSDDAREATEDDESFSNFLTDLTDVPAGQLFLEQCCCVEPSQGCPREDSANVDLQSVGLVETEKIESEEEDQFVFARSSFEDLPTISGRQAVIKPGVCPPHLLGCCFPPGTSNLSSLAGGCLSPAHAQLELDSVKHGWTQGCSDKIPVPKSITKECGTRVFLEGDTNLEKDNTWPGEFPWSCLILTKSNGVVGSCVIVPDQEGLGNTKRVLTVAHIVTKADPKSLKVRVGEHDTRKFSWPVERENFKEHQVADIVVHQQFDKSRLGNDLAVLVLEREVDLAHPHVNTVCLPSCDQQFDHRFPNTSGVFCWSSGWVNGKNGFQAVMKKVPYPLVDDDSCISKLKPALDSLRPGLGSSFNLLEEEVCADSQASCDREGLGAGSPLVCQSQSGRWTLVGILTWAMDDCSVPAVFARLSKFSSWLSESARTSPGRSS